MKKFILIFVISLFLIPFTLQASSASLDWLKGYILLQVQANGEAWYVNPVDFNRYYMKDGEAAYQMMRSFGLGITNVDLSKIPIGIESRFQEVDSDNDGLPDKLEEALGTDPKDSDTDNDGYLDGVEVKAGYNPLNTGKMPVDSMLTNRLKGRILLQVQSKGEAWYLYPKDGKRYYMKDGEAAYQIMRYLSLGITNSNLDLITKAEINSANPSLPAPTPTISPTPRPTPTATPSPTTPTPTPIPPSISFNESADTYYQIENLINVGGKAAYFAETFNNEFYVVHGDTKIKVGNYPDVDMDMIASINGKLAYLYHDSRVFKDYIIYNNEKIGENYWRIYYIFDANGTLGFVAQDSTEQGGKSYLVINGIKQREYDEIIARADVSSPSIIIIDGKPIYKARKNGQLIMVHGDTEDNYFPNQNIGNPVNINNKPAYWVIMQDGGDAIVVDNTIVVKDVDLYIHTSVPVTEVNNKLTYVEIMGTTQYRVVYGGQAQQIYTSIEDVQEIGGKLTYQAQDSSKSYIIQDGQKLTVCSYVEHPTNISGHLVYLCADSAISSAIGLVYDGQKVGKKYNGIQQLTEVNGKIYFVAQRIEGGTYYNFIVNQQ